MNRKVPVRFGGGPMEKYDTVLVEQLASGLPCSLEITDPGFDFSVLSEFRSRLLTNQAERRIFDIMLSQFRERGWIKERGKQRTDSTHVLAAIRTVLANSKEELDKEGKGLLS
jgi:transposase